MALINQSEIREAIARSGFGREAIRFLQHERFQPNEVEYKLRLAADLRKAQDAVLNQESTWLDLLKEAINSPEDNIVNWRLRKPFLAWCQNNSDLAKRALTALWNSSLSLDDRIDSFAGILLGAGISQPGQQLCITSVLLMATAPVECPPVRARVLSTALEKLGLLKVPSDASIAERYQVFVSLLDGLIEFSQASSRPLRNRLEAQGTVWCVTGGWKGLTLDTGFKNVHGDLDEDAEKDILDAAQELENLEETERRAVISARRGQGRYRNDLLNLWVGCAVTGCAIESLLRASHLKPWKLSNNAERLDRFNGLLLTPNLDLALDRGLISFTDSGSILISSSLKADDSNALGLHTGLKLRFINPKHKPHLAFHRAKFLEREQIMAK